MAAGRKRHKLRRARQQASRANTALLERLAFGQAGPPALGWPRFSKWMACLGAALAVFATLSLYPWLGVREEGISEETLRSSFAIVNHAYLPVTALSADCTFTSNNPRTIANFKDSDVLLQHFRNRLEYAEEIAVPCIGKMPIDPSGSIVKADSGAVMEIEIWYRLLGVLVHLPQQFRFEVKRSADGQFRLVKLKR